MLGRPALPLGAGRRVSVSVGVSVRVSVRVRV
jgi:hypothetical protein